MARGMDGTRALKVIDSTSQYFRSFAVSSTASPKLHTSYVEVEKKFLPTLQLEAQLLRKSTVKHPLPSVGKHNHESDYKAIIEPRDLTFTRWADSLIEDTYYDLRDQLSKQGIWVRRRTISILSAFHSSAKQTAPSHSILEAKVKLGGTYNNSQFYEFTGARAIRAYLEDTFKDKHDLNLDDLSISAQLRSYRKKWGVYENKKCSNVELNQTQQLSIVIDEVSAPNKPGPSFNPFHHRIGEIEMTMDVIGGRDNHEHAEIRRHAAGRLNDQIYAFISAYSHLFEIPQELKGILRAYFEWKKQHQSARET